MKPGKEVARRKEKGIFCILFVAAWTKRMASGGTRPAGSGFDFDLNLFLCSESRQFATIQIKKGPPNRRALFYLSCMATRTTGALSGSV